MDKIAFKILNYFSLYNKLNKEIKSSIWFTICNFFQKGFQFLSIIIFTRLLIPEEFGKYTLYLSWFTIISSLSTLSLYADTFNIGYSKYKNKYNFYISIIGLSIFFVLLTGAISWLFRKNLPYILFQNDVIFVYFFIQLLCFTLLQFWSAQQRFEYKYKALVIVTFGQMLITLFISLILLIFLDALALYLIIATSIGYLIVALYVIYDIKNNIKFTFTTKYWKNSLWFALPLLPHYFAYMALAQADRVIIGNIQGVEAAAYYGVAYQISQAVALIRISIHGSYLPWLYNQLKKEEYENIKFVTDRIALLLLTLIFIAILLGPETLKIFASNLYRDALWSMPPLILSAYYMFLFTVFMSVELYFGNNNAVMIASVSCAVINIMLDYLLLPYFEYYVIAYKTLACYALLAFFHFYLCKKTLPYKLKIEKIFHYKKLFLYSNIGVICMCFYLFLYNYDIVRIIFIGIVLSLVIYNKNYVIQTIKSLKMN